MTITIEPATCHPNTVRLKVTANLAISNETIHEFFSTVSEWVRWGGSIGN